MNVGWTPISTFYNAELLEEKKKNKRILEPVPEEIKEQPSSTDGEINDEACNNEKI